MSDNVNHPSHYTSGKVECIDALEAATAGLQGIEAVCTANAIKYLWRWRQKNGIEDLKKAVWYINHLLERLSPDPEPELENEWEKQVVKLEMEWHDYLKAMERRFIERMEQNDVGNITIKQACIEKAPSD